MTSSPKPSATTASTLAQAPRLILDGALDPSHRKALDGAR